MAEKSGEGGAEAGGMSLPAKLAVGTALGLGALITGFAATRQGRRLVRETLRGRMRPPREYDVLEVLDRHPRLGRRRLDVRQEEEGGVALVGSVASEAERRLALRLASRVPGVTVVRDALVIAPAGTRRRS